MKLCYILIASSSSYLIEMKSRNDTTVHCCLKAAAPAVAAPWLPEGELMCVPSRCESRIIFTVFDYKCMPNTEAFLQTANSSILLSNADLSRGDGIVRPVKRKRMC